MSETPEHGPSVLLVGLDEKSKKVIEQQLKNTTVEEVSTREAFLKMAADLSSGRAFSAAFCGPGISDLQALDLAQTLRFLFMGKPLLYMSPSREGYDPVEIKRNGFDHAFLVDFEAELLLSSVSKIIETSERPSFKRVQLHDLVPDSTLDFDAWLYLPMNDKYVQYITEGDPIDSARIDRLSKHQHQRVFVPEGQMDRFYDYVAKSLQSTMQSNALSKTEKKERLQKSVQGLLEELLGDTDAGKNTVEHGRLLMKDAQKVVNQYILSGDQNDWYKKVVETLGTEKDQYSHSTSVSTYAALFSIALEQGRPEDCATAGLFHDLGLAEVPLEIQNKPEVHRTSEERKLWRLHPEVSVRLLKEKKLSLPPNVYTAITQHHEAFDGTGYPKGYAGSKISIEAQIVSIADEFDYLTVEKAGVRKLEPLEAMERLSQDRRFDPELIKELKKLFKSKKAA